MNVVCQDTTVLTSGETAELAARLHSIPSQTLTLMAAGMEPDPVACYVLLDLELGMQAGGDDRIHELLDRGLFRLEEAFGPLN